MMILMIYIYITVVGRRGTKMKDWAMEYFEKQ